MVRARLKLGPGDFFSAPKPAEEIGGSFVTHKFALDICQEKMARRLPKVEATVIEI